MAKKVRTAKARPGAKGAKPLMPNSALACRRSKAVKPAASSRPPHPKHWSIGVNEAHVKFIALRHKDVPHGPRVRAASSQRTVDTSEADAVLERWKLRSAGVVYTLPVAPWRSAPCKPRIQCIERIENVTPWASFKEACRPLVESGGTREVLAWHGTCTRAAWRIAHEGFREGAQGLWMAHDSTYSWDYSVRKQQGTYAQPQAGARLQVVRPCEGWDRHTWKGEFVMILCRVLVVDLPALKSYPYHSNHVNVPWAPGATHLVHTTALAYPEYLVHLAV